MDLFRSQIARPENLLPKDGVAHYHGIIVDLDAADEYLRKLLERIAWQNDEAIIFGKRIVTKRKVAWHADGPYEYTYSRTTKRALPWSPELKALKAIAELKTGATFNACLLNLYHDGNEGMAWHSDSEKELQHGASIASLSFGAERKFSFKHKQSKETLSLVLEHGSLLEMKDATQSHWLHRLPPSKRIVKPRVNLTFRNMGKHTR